MAGVPALLVPRACEADPVALLAILRQHAVTRLTAVPSLLAALLPVLQQQQPDDVAASQLRVVVSSGEPLPAALWAQLQAALPRGARVLNLYGSTEVAGDATFFDPTERGWAPAPGQEATATVPVGALPPPPPPRLRTGVAGASPPCHARRHAH